MIKRHVILQDEQYVVHEIDKVPQGSHAVPWVAGAPAEDDASPAFQSPRLPQAQVPACRDEETENRSVRSTVTTQEGRKLADIAREASLTAERSAIEGVLTRVHWNRRKAAQSLGVSYKTLLNRIKQTGLEQP